MTISATFNGQTYQFPDGTSDDEIYAAINSTKTAANTNDLASTENLPQEQPTEWGFSKEGQDGSVLETLKARVGAMGESMLAANTSPELSNYANAKARRAIKGWQTEQEKLGVAGQVAAGLAEAVPAIGAGIINPALGGSIAAGQGYGSTLISQGVEGNDFDMQKAQRAAVAMGTTDATLGGLGRTAATMFAAGKPAIRVGAEVVEDAGSSGASMAFENLGADKDWYEGVAEAAAFGAGAGQGLRRGAGAFNRLRETAPNKSGEEALDQVSKMRSKNATPPEDFVDNSYGYQNQYKDLNEQMSNAKSNEEIDDLSHKVVNFGAKEGADAADLKTFEMMEGMTFTDSALNTDFSRDLSRSGEGYNFGRQAGLTDKEMLRGADVVENARQSIFGRDGAITRAETKASFEEKFQQEAIKKAGNMDGTYTSNVDYAKNLMERLRNDPGASSQAKAWANELDTKLSSLQTAVRDYVGHKKLDTSSRIKTLGRESLALANKLGVRDDLVGINGKPGTWDPVVDAMAFDRMTRVMDSQMSSFSNRAPNVAAETAEGARIHPVSAAIHPKTALGIGGIKGLISSIGGKGSQRALAKAKLKTKNFLEAKASDIRNQSLMDGDIKGAASEAEADLASKGLTPIKAESETAPVEQPTVDTEAPVQALVREPTPLGGVRKPAVVEPVEAIVEPVVPKAEPTLARKPTKREIKKERMERSTRTERSKKQEVEPEVAPKAAGTGAGSKVSKPKVEVEPIKEVESKPEEVIKSSGKGAGKAVKQPTKPTPVEPEVETKVEETPVEVETKEKRSSASDLAKKPMKDVLENTPEIPVKDRKKLAVQHQARMKAEEDLKAVESHIDAIADQRKITTEEAASIFNDMGGLSKIREELEAKGHKPSYERKYINQRAVELLDLKRKEAVKKASELKEIAREPVKTEVLDKAETTTKDSAVDIADKHIRVREELAADGYSKDVIEKALKDGKASEKGVDFNPSIVHRYARSAHKAEKARITAELSSAEKAITKAIKDARESTFNTKRDTPQYLENEIAVYEKVLKKPSSDINVSQIHDKIDILKEKLSKARKLEEKNNQAKADAEKAKQEAISLRKQQEASDKAEKESMARESEMKEIDSQIDDFTKALKAAGADDDFVQKTIHNTFIKRSKPLSEQELNKTRAKAFNDMERQAQRTTEARKDKIAPAVAKLSDVELKEVSSEVTKDIPKIASAPEHQALVQTIQKELKNRGLDVESDQIKTFNDALVKGEEMKAKYPNNPEYWLSRSDFIEMQKAYNKGEEGKANVGNLGMILRTHLFGNSSDSNVRLSNSEIEARIAGGKVDSDIKVTMRKKFSGRNKARAK